MRYCKKIVLLILVLLCIMIIPGCGKNRAGKPDNVLLIRELHNGDAKFYKEQIITTLNEHLTMIDKQSGDIHTYEQIQASWIDSIEDEGIIVYGNFQNEIGIARLNENNEITENSVILHSENLLIDPTISKLDGTYYLTDIEIVGNVNNSDPEVKNGQYTIHLYRSADLKEWEFVSDVVAEPTNLEDVDVILTSDRIMVFYEKEVFDMQASGIYCRISEDGGQNWSEPIELLAQCCDQEPAAVVKTENGYKLFYSSDAMANGKSYMGAKAYYALYDQDLQLLEKDVRIPLTVKKGIVLYDVYQESGKWQYLYNKDCLTDCDLRVDEEK